MSERQLHNVVSIQLQYHSTMCTSFPYWSVLQHMHGKEIWERSASRLISYDVAPGQCDVKDIG